MTHSAETTILEHLILEDDEVDGGCFIGGDTEVVQDSLVPA